MQGRENGLFYCENLKKKPKNEAIIGKSN